MKKEMYQLYQYKKTLKEVNSIKDLNQGELIYVSKIESGHQVIYECEYIEFSRGIVRAKVTEAAHEYRGINKPGCIITARITNCFLWKQSKSDNRPYCHWFKKNGEV